MVIFKSVCFLLTWMYNVLTSHPTEATMLLKRRCDVSESTLMGVLRSACFVDKTYITETFLLMEPGIYIVSAPTGFGKTINMQTLKTFFQSEEGVISSKVNKGCGIFRDNFLHITTHKTNVTDYFKDHCGKYPVIHVDLKGVKGSDMPTVLDSFRDVIRQTFSEHEYLTSSEKLEVGDKMKVKVFIHDQKKVDRYEIEDSLKFLSEMLYTHFNKSVTLLMDHFDAPLLQLIDSSFRKKELLGALRLFKDFASTTLNNIEYTDKILVNVDTRFYRIMCEDVTNNITHLSYLDVHPLTKYYGFTSQEMKNLLNKFKIRDNDHEIKDFYDGYRTKALKKMHSIRSVTKFMEYEVLGDYWVDVVDNIRMYLQNPELRKLIVRIIDSSGVQIRSDQDVRIEYLYSIRRMLAKNEIMTEDQATKFLQFLTDYGYFVPARTATNKETLAIPNDELRLHLLNIMNDYEYIQNYFKPDPRAVDDFLQALNSLGTGTNRKTSITKFLCTVNNLFSNHSIPDSNCAFQTYLHYIIGNSDLFSLTDREVTGFIRKTKKKQLYLSPKGGLVRNVKRDKRVAKVKSGILTVRNSDGAGIAIETRYNYRNADDALLQIVNSKAPCYKLFESDVYKGMVKEGRIYVGLHYNSDDKVVTGCYLVNTVNLTSITCDKDITAFTR